MVQQLELINIDKQDEKLHNNNSNLESQPSDSVDYVDPGESESVSKAEKWFYFNLN